MKLFSKEVDKKLFAQYPKGANLENQNVVTKIFNPYGAGRWYLLNSDPADPDYIWAIVEMRGEVEMGSVSRKELESIRIRPFGLPLERDLYFSPVNAAELYQGLRQGKFYKSGGWTEGEENKAMLLNQAEGFEHHAEELEDAVKKSDHIPAWVVAKSERASTDLSDITHYLDGENEQKREEMEGEEMAKGGLIRKGGYYVSLTGNRNRFRIRDIEGNKVTTVSSKKDGTDVINYAEEKDNLEYLLEKGLIKKVNEKEYWDKKYEYSDGGEMAKGGEVKWQDAQLGDSALVVSENKMGVIIKPYGRKFHLKFVDGTEKTYDASELKFFGDVDDFDRGGRTSDGRRLDVGRFYRTKDGRQVRYLGDSTDPELGTFMNKADGVFKVRYDEIEGKASVFENGGQADFGDFYEWSGKEVNKKFKSQFDEGFPIVKFVKDSGNKIVESAIGVLKDGTNVIFDVEKVEWNFDDKMAKGGKTKSEEVVYIEYRNAKKGFSKDKKYFRGDNGYNEAVKWGRKNLGNFNMDMVKFEMGKGGKVSFADKVASVKKSLLKRKKVPKSVQKDYGKTFSPKEAEDSAKRIVGAMTAKERLMKSLKRKK